MIDYFYGEDLYRTEVAIRQRAQKISATIRWIDTSDQTTYSNLAEALVGGTGLFARELVVARDISAWPKNRQTQIIAFIDQETTGEIIFWDRVPPDKRSALFRALKPHAHEYTYLNEADVVAEIIQLVTQQKGQISQVAARHLVNIVGKDGWRLRSEVSRLLLQADTITEPLIDQEIPQPPQAEIFRTIEAIAAGRSKVALEQIDSLLQMGQSEFYILSMMAYQFRTLYLIKTNQSAEAKIHPYVVQKSQTLLGRFSANQLLEILTRLLAVDVAIKQGKMEPRTGLTMTVLGLVAT